MRYYDLAIIAAKGSSPMSVWSSHPQGVFDPAAANILFDIPVLPYATPSGGQTITIEGVSLQQISQAQQLAGMNVVLKAGMGAGLPLSNPAQAGVIVQGQIFQSFGNWEGTDMTLDIVLLPSIYNHDNPGNFVLHWKAGQLLSDALKETLSTAYPNLPISIMIGSNIVMPNDEIHIATSLEDLAQYIHDITQSVFGQPVTITVQSGKIIVYDSTMASPTISLAFTDMIGQPTWIDKNVMQVKTVMRSDIQVGSSIVMPKGIQNVPGLVSTQANAYPSSIRYQSAFQNTFTVIELRQIGNYRAPDGASWCTVFNCVTNAP